MTRERAAELLSDVTVLDDPEMEEAHKMAISALRQQERFGEANKTLTLDELRQMPIRDWVWIDVLHSKEAVSSYYRKYDGYKKDEIFWCGYPGLGFRFFYEDYGKTWMAYRQKQEEDKHESN